MRTRDKFFIIRNRVRALFSEATPKGQTALTNILHNCCCEFDPCNQLTLEVSSDYGNDADAATAGIEIGQLYHTSGVVKIRLV